MTFDMKWHFMTYYCKCKLTAASGGDIDYDKLVTVKKIRVAYKVGRRICKCYEG